MNVMLLAGVSRALMAVVSLICPGFTKAPEVKPAALAVLELKAYKTIAMVLRQESPGDAQDHHPLRLGFRKATSEAKAHTICLEKISLVGQKLLMRISSALKVIDPMKWQGLAKAPGFK